MAKNDKFFPLRLVFSQFDRGKKISHHRLIARATFG